MLTRRSFVGATIAIGITAAHASAQSATPAATPAGDLAAELDAVLSDQSLDVPFMGVALIEQGGELLLRAGFGDAEAVRRIPNDPEMGYQIASVTKTFTATLIMQLRDEGKLTLDDPVATYLDYPNLEQEGVPITIRRLLNHTAGVVDFLDLYDLRDFNAYPDTLDQMLARIAEEPLSFTPGSEFSYSNSGYLYLGQIVQAVTGSSWEAELTGRILDPLGLTRTWLTPPSNPRELATGYLYIEGFLAPVSRLGRTDLAQAAGGLTSTVDDLHTWWQAFRTGQVVKPSTVEEMLTPGLNGYGLGVEQFENDITPAFGHFGLTIGFRSSIHYLTQLDTTIILLSNRQDTAIETLVDRLMAVLAVPGSTA